jgi:orotidine-5'-phosphate decarboxylase
MDKIRETGNPTVVGLDPTLGMVPDHLKNEAFGRYGKTPEAVGKMFTAFNKAIIDEIGDLIPAVKPQIAMYEQYGLEGLKAYLETIRYAAEHGLLVIGDIKRGDIASTAEAYAGHLAGVDIEGAHFDLWREDAVTLNPYMGYDGIEPFVKICSDLEKGAFILVKTSNPSSMEIQDLIADGRPIFHHTAELVSKWGLAAMGRQGYSKIGAVVGATCKEQGQTLRGLMPHTFFLVPGYGAQGGTGDDLKGYVDGNGKGIIVNSSRGIIAAYLKETGTDGRHFAKAARKAVLSMKEDLRKAIG